MHEEERVIVGYTASYLPNLNIEAEVFNSILGDVRLIMDKRYLTVREA